MKTAESTENYDLLSILKKNVIFIIAIYLYFMGWIYAHYLYKHFGISLNSMDIPFYYFFVYSYSVIVNGVGGIIVVVILLVYLFTCKYFKKMSLALILIGLIPIFFYVAEERADREARYMRMGKNVKRIIFTFKKDVNKFYPKKFIDANNKGKLQLITQTKDRYYIFYQTTTGENRAIPYGMTYDISRTDIILVTINMQDNEELKK